MTKEQPATVTKANASEKKIGALSTFLQMLDKLKVGSKPLRYFRGHLKASFELKPSVFRNDGLIKNESTILRELILRCPNDFAGGLTTFQCLVKMQHYGLPTRLLDVTSNPLVALYFATESVGQDDEDGEVVVLDYGVDEVKYFDSDTVSVIANLSRRPSKFEVPASVDGDLESFDDAIKTFNSNKFIELLLHDIRSEKPHFASKIRPDDIHRVICVKPHLDNPRIIRQEGSFLLFGCGTSKTEPAKLEQSAIVAKLTINRDEKKNLRNQLRLLGISQATLFPEIEHVAKYIKESYESGSIDLAELTEIQKKVFAELRQGASHAVDSIASARDINASSVTRALTELQRRKAVEPVGSGGNRQWTLTDGLEIRDTNE